MRTKQVVYVYNKEKKREDLPKLNTDGKRDTKSQIILNILIFAFLDSWQEGKKVLD
jgi:hypothetical protein